MLPVETYPNPIPEENATRLSTSNQQRKKLATKYKPAHFSERLVSYFAVLTEGLCLVLSTQHGIEVSGRTWALESVPDETSGQLLGAGLRSEPPLILSQHVKPAPTFVLLTAQVSCAGIAVVNVRVFYPACLVARYTRMSRILPPWDRALLVSQI